MFECHDQEFDLMAIYEFKTELLEKNITLNSRGGINYQNQLGCHKWFGRLEEQQMGSTPPSNKNASN
jgi:hypothetical protein